MKYPNVLFLYIPCFRWWLCVSTQSALILIFLCSFYSLTEAGESVLTIVTRLIINEVICSKLSADKGNKFASTTCADSSSDPCTAPNIVVFSCGYPGWFITVIFWRQTRQTSLAKTKCDRPKSQQPEHQPSLVSQKGLSTRIQPRQTFPQNTRGISQTQKYKCVSMQAWRSKT